MKSLKRNNSSKQYFLSSKHTDIKDNQNEIILDTDDLEQDDDNFNTFERFQSMQRRIPRTWKQNAKGWNR